MRNPIHTIPAATAVAFQKTLLLVPRRRCRVPEADEAKKATQVAEGNKGRASVLSVAIATFLSSLFVFPASAVTTAGGNASEASTDTSREASAAPVRIVQANASTADFNLPAQPLADSLRAVAGQTNSNILFDRNLVQGLPAKPLKAQLSVAQALQALLKGTGLTYRNSDDKTIMIVSERTNAQTSFSRGEAVAVNLAQADQAMQKVEGQKNEEQSSSEEKSSVNPDKDAADQDTKATTEVVVTGSRLRDTAGTAVPVTVFDRARIDELGISTVPAILNYLPQQSSINGDLQRPGLGFSFAQLRGLSWSDTLVLINGRRTTPSGLNPSFNAFDLSTIPLAAVERVEVLSDSASAVYGTDAIGGVINVILKKNIPHPVVELRYGAAKGGAEERRASLSAGYSVGRFRSSVLFDYFDREPLLGRERDRTANQDFRRFGGTDFRSTLSIPGNVCSTNGANLPGLPTPCAAMPHGSTGVGLTPADFLATAGQRNLESLTRFQTFILDSTSRSGMGSLEFDFTEHLTLFSELIFTRLTNSRELWQSAGRGLLVPATNPFNPFGTDVRVDYLLSGVGPRITSNESESYRVLAGLRGQVREWDWELSHLRTDDRGGGVSGTNGAGSTAVNAALNATNPAETLNVFQDGPGGSTELLASLVIPGVPSKSRSEAMLSSGYIRGPLFSLPAGEFAVVAGAEARRETLRFSSGLTTDREVSAVFSEMHLPLIASAMAIPGIRELSLTMAVRYDHYNDFGSTTNPQFRINWAPIENVALRASYGRGFRAPSLFELYSPRQQAAAQPAVDPKRNNENVLIPVFFGGNSALDPVKSQAMSAGIVFTPDWQKGLRFTADYWRISMEDTTNSLSTQLILNFEDMFPGRVVRASPSLGDIAANRPGPITRVEAATLNFGTVKTNGVDVGLSHEFQTGFGRFNASLTGTWVGKFEAVKIPGVPPADVVGIARPISSEGTIPRWRAVGTIGWSRNGMALSTTVRTAASYDDATLVGLTGRTISGQTLMDIQGSIRIEENAWSWFNGLKITAGVENLLDKEPPFSEASGFSGPVGYDPSQASLRGRFGYMAITKEF